MQVQPTRYIYPPRASAVVPRGETMLLAQRGWLAQYKFNDSRCLVKHLPGGAIELWNRHGARFRDYEPPEGLVRQLRTVFYERLGWSATGYHLLDGGLLDRKHAAIKHTIVLWDFLVRDGDQQLRTSYAQRYAQLGAAAVADQPMIYPRGTVVGSRLTADVFIAGQWPASEWSLMWEHLERENSPYPPNSPLLEGLVYKCQSSLLEPGFREQNNGALMVRSRVQTGRHLC